CKILIAHNGVKFDFPMLELFGVLDYKIGFTCNTTVFGKECQIIDTLVLSRLLNPNRNGGHSIKNWGRLTKDKKIPFRKLCIDKGYIDAKAPKGAEFKQFGPEMVDYCEQDTLVNKTTFSKLTEEKAPSSG